MDWRTASAVPWNHSPPSSVCSAARMVTKPREKASNLYVWPTWLLRLSELYCVSTKMRRRSELMQLESGMSMSRYLPAMGTAGLDRSRVRGKSRVPRPPPRITARQSCMGNTYAGERRSQGWMAFAGGDVRAAPDHYTLAQVTHGAARVPYHPSAEEATDGTTHRRPHRSLAARGSIRRIQAGAPGRVLRPGDRRGEAPGRVVPH